MFQPPASVRGDIARALFYMAVRVVTALCAVRVQLFTCGVWAQVRYDGSAADPGTRDLELHESPDASWGYMGVLSVLQQWHTDDPVDDAERLRNGLVCGQQGNRNPFIDHPEWVSIIDWSGYVRPIVALRVRPRLPHLSVRCLPATFARMRIRKTMTTARGMSSALETSSSWHLTATTPTPSPLCRPWMCRRVL